MPNPKFKKRKFFLSMLLSKIIFKLTKKTSVTTKQQIVFVTAIFTIPFTIFMLAYNVNTANVFNEKIVQANKSRMNFYQSYLEENLHSVEIFMANLVANDLDYGRLRYDLSYLDAHLYTYNILEKYKDILGTNKIVSGLFIYTNNNGIYRHTYHPSVDLNEKEKIEKFFKAYLGKNEKPELEGWVVHKIGEKNYLFRILGGGETFSICMVDFELISVPWLLEEGANDGFILYTSKEGVPYTSLDLIRERNIQLEVADDSYYVTGKKEKWLAVQDYSHYSSVNIVHIKQYHGLFNTMEPFQLSLLIATIVLIALLYICFSLLKRYFLTPLNDLVETMNCIKSGDMEVYMSQESRIKEFQQVSETFNAMIAQIKEIKIVAYEKTLELQQAKLQYLQIQIRPHFFLNCLKNLYGMAQMKKYQQIQDMIIALSNYLRSMFKDTDVTIPLESELHNTETYIMLQQMALITPLQCTIDADTQLASFKIPPLSILTFVENAVKHGISTVKILKIHVKVKLLITEKEQYVNITILDNGPGFSNEILKILNSENNKGLSNTYVGIANVKSRLVLIFGDKSMIHFNRSNGSVVEIFIPYSN